MKRITLSAILFFLALTMSCSQKLEEPESIGTLAVSITANPLSQTAPADVFFQSSVSGGKTPYSWHWTFGDGSVDTSQGTTVHRYQGPGTYSAKLRILSADGQIAEDIETVLIGINRLTVDAYGTVPLGQVPFTTMLVANATGGVGPMTYTWKNGSNNEFSTAQNVQRTITDVGARLYIVEVRSSDGQTAADTVTITGQRENVPNQPPIVRFSLSPKNGVKGETAIYGDASKTTDDSQVTKMVWYWGDGDSSIGITASHVYSVSGLQGIRVVATDDSLAVSEGHDDVYILEPDQPLGPVAIITISPSVQYAGLPIVFNGANSFSFGSQIVDFNWQFSDFEFGTGSTVNRTYATPGTKSVTLTVTDANNATASKTMEFEVISINRDPVCMIVASPTTGNTGEPFIFRARATDPENRLAGIGIYFDTGDSVRDSIATRTFSRQGRYGVTVKAWDRDGGYCDHEITVTVLTPTERKKPIPILLATPSQGVANETQIRWDATASHDEDGFIKSYSIRFGDGSAISRDSIAYHVYANAGRYTAMLIVVDNDNLSDSIMADVVITQPEPVGPFILNCDALPTQGITGETEFTFSAEASRDSQGRPFTTYWTFDDGSRINGLNVSRYFQESGMQKAICHVITVDHDTLTDARYVWVWPSLPETQDTCWADSIESNMTTTFTNTRVEANIQNPAGEFFVRLTLKYKHAKPDVISGIEFLSGNRRIVFTIPDPFPGYEGEQIVTVVLPQSIYFDANIKVALTWQAGHQQNTVRLLKIEGCTKVGRF